MYKSLTDKIIKHYLAVIGFICLIGGMIIAFYFAEINYNGNVAAGALLFALFSSFLIMADKR